MDFDGFLAACREQWDGFDDEHALARHAHPRDRRLARLPELVPGFATENKLMLLNLAARHLEDGEVYVEVGTWQGLSLIGAAWGNDGKRLYACDDFSKAGVDRALLQRHLARHRPAAEVHVYACGYREFLRTAPWRPARVGAYFYDGPHGFADHFAALAMIRPWLAADAVVIVDDTEDRPVRAANRLVVRHASNLERVLDIRVPYYTHPTWWNGVQLFHWRNGGPVEPLDVSRRAYLARRLLWTRPVVYAQRLADFARIGARRLRRAFRSG